MTGDPRAVLFSGGVGHPFAETSPALDEMLQDAGWASRIVTDLDQALAALPGAELFAINALYWSMTQDEKYAPLRDTWARSLADHQMDAIESFVLGGGRLFVLHTGTICWDTQPRWKALMGGGWQWGVSHHPPLGPVPVTLSPLGRQLVNGAPAFELVDEAYHSLRPAPDCQILATADLGEGPQPMAWLRTADAGRVAVDALGHDLRSLGHPAHRALIQAQLFWLAG